MWLCPLMVNMNNEIIFAFRSTLSEMPLKLKLWSAACWWLSVSCIWIMLCWYNLQFPRTTPEMCVVCNWMHRCVERTVQTSFLRVNSSWICSGLLRRCRPAELIGHTWRSNLILSETEPCDGSNTKTYSFKSQITSSPCDTFVCVFTWKICRLATMEYEGHKYYLRLWE